MNPYLSLQILSYADLSGPHRPIPALPDAGYTAPTLRAASLTGYANEMIQLHPGGGGFQRGPGGEGSIYAGGSLYNGQNTAHTHHGQPQQYYASSQEGSSLTDGWSASLPAPRRAPIIPTPLQHQPHHPTFARLPNHDERGRSHERSHSGTHSPQHHHRGNQSDDSDFDDGASDASYYAMPRQRSRHNRASSHDSSASELSSPDIGRVADPRDRNDLHRRTVAANHKQGQTGRYRSPSASAPGSPSGHEQSPILPSPLRMKERDSDRGPAVTRGRRSSLGLEDGLGLAGLEITGTGRPRRSSHTSSHYLGLEGNGRSGSYEGDVRSKPIRPILGNRQRSKLRPVKGSLSDSEQTSARRISVNRSFHGRTRQRSREEADLKREELDSEDEEREHRSAKQSSHAGEGRKMRAASMRRGNSRRVGDEEEESPYHRPLIPVDHSPLLSPHSSLAYEGSDLREPKRPSIGQHRHNSHQDHQAYEDNAGQYKHQTRRRTNSDHNHNQTEYIRPPNAGTLYPNHSASLIGGDAPNDHYQQHLHPMSAGGNQPFPGYEMAPQQQQMGMYTHGPGFDDGVSVAGSALTFMDAPMGGRVSQYGLPKYAHNPKVDYRR